MIADVTFALAAPIAGFFTALCLLLLWVGGSPAPEDESDPVLLNGHEPIGDPDHDGPFIAMPSHLKTSDEMVAWMTRDLPRLTSELPKPRI